MKEEIVEGDGINDDVVEDGKDISLKGEEELCVNNEEFEEEKEKEEEKEEEKQIEKEMRFIFLKSMLNFCNDSQKVDLLINQLVYL